MVGFVGVTISLIPWRRSMIGVVGMTICIIPSSAVGVVGVSPFFISPTSSSLSQVSNDVLRLYTDCREQNCNKECSECLVHSSI